MKISNIALVLSLFIFCLQQIKSQDFGPKQIITTNVINPKSIYAIDLDGDGDADVLSASEIGVNIGWYENLGAGNFGTQNTITSDALHAQSVYSIDLNGDGLADVLSASSSDDKIAWYENLGGGNFSVQNLITMNAHAAESVYAIDLDGDGDIDVLSASRDDNKVAWYQNNGSGIFGTQQVITTSANFAESVHANDLDGDGDIDVLSASAFDDKVAWYQNDGNGNFGSQQLISTNASSPNSVFSVDLDGDNDVDVLSIGSNDNVVWYRNNGVGVFSSEQIITTNYNPGLKIIYATDIDNDGDTDVLLSTFGGNVILYKNDGTGDFGSEIIIGSNANGVNTVFAIDLDGDGDLDVLSASESDDIVIWFENFLTEPKVVGKSFYDENENGFFDLSERGLDNIAFDYSPSGIVYFSGANGTVSLPLLEDDESITIREHPDWLITTDNSLLIENIDTSVVDTIYFGLSPINQINDLTINITSSLPRCNTEVPFQIIVTNTGTTILNGTLETTNIDLINYVEGSANPSPDNTIDEQLSWNFEGIYPGESFTVDLNFNVNGPPSIEVGDSLCLNVMATILTESTEETTYNPPPPTGETDLVSICHCTGSGINPYVVLELPQSAVDGQGNYDHANHGCDIIPITDLNNDGNIDVLDCLTEQTTYTETTFLGSYKTEIRCSFDPNDKAANPAGESDENYTLMGQDIIYTIRFQNTGNDTAFRVELIDTLSENLNIETFDFITSSHRPVDITIESVPNQEEHVLKFLFEDILLPDSTTDQPGSNGFVQFSIRPEFGLPEPTILTNDAGIYFDFNPPVITNLVDHTLVYTIPDYRAPIADCQNELEIELDENGNATIRDEELNLNSTDNVGITSFEASQTSFNCTNIGNNSVQLTVFDAAENSAVCQANVIVKDNIKPTIECEDIVLTIQDGETITLTPEEVTTSISDNCSIASSILSKNTFSNTDAGDNSITLVVKDPSGNETSCNINVKIEVVSNVLESQFGITATIAPNPFSNFATLSLSKALPFNYDVKIVDLSGKVIQEYLNQNQQIITIENQNWASGIYLLNVFESGKNEVLGSFRIVIE